MKYDICGTCEWHSSPLDICTFCDEGDQYEEADPDDWVDPDEEEEEDSARAVIPILLAA